MQLRKNWTKKFHVVAILEFDSSAGSIHPLAVSRLPSMDNSIRGVSDSRTVTDVPTLEVRDSLASGSQGRARRGRSEDPRQRRRAHSEDCLGTMTVERGGNRLAVKSETKIINVSSDESISGDSSAEELELLKETGRGAQMSRRKGRSAEELQARPKRSRATPEVASLDRLPEVSQTRISRRPEAQNMRNVKDHQTNSSRGTGREEGQARDDATLVSNRSRSRNPVVAHPTPKPRKTRSRRQSENSSMSVPPGPTGKADRQGQSNERPIALNRSQGWSSPPAPNYHIHINIQSPNSPPAQQLPTMSTLDGHSAVHRTPVTTIQPVHPFLDNSTSLDERPVWPTFARQESRPDILPQPVRHACLRQESRQPKVTEAVMQTHVRQESYPPRVAESLRHAYIRHAAPPTKLVEPVRPTYIRQETYPRENARWNDSSSRRFFRELVPMMVS